MTPCYNNLKHVFCAILAERKWSTNKILKNLSVQKSFAIAWDTFIIYTYISVLRNVLLQKSILWSILNGWSTPEYLLKGKIS